MSLYEEEFADEFVADPQDAQADAQRALEARFDRNRPYITAWQRRTAGTITATLTPNDFPASVVEKFDAFMNSGKVNVLFGGDPGRGKTAFATVVGSIFATNGRWVEMYTFQQAFGLVFSKKAEAEAALDAMENCDLLILDDFGAKAPHPDQITRIAEIIENRANQPGRKWTIITANSRPSKMEADLDAKEAEEPNQNPGYAPMKRLLSRLAATIIAFPIGPDLRKENWK